MTNYEILGVNDGSKSRQRLEFEWAIEDGLEHIRDEIYDKCNYCPCKDLKTYTSCGKTYCACIESVLTWLMKEAEK